MTQVLVLNSGSSSIKYQLLDMADRTRLAVGNVERIGESTGAVSDHAAGMRVVLSELRRERPRDTIWIATKAGRRLPAQTPDGYSRANLQAWVERSLSNLRVEAIDLLQLHCPHPEVYDRPDVFGALDDLVRDGKLRYYGVSVETCEEAVRAMRYPNVQSVQIIFNMFRTKPAERVFPEASRRQVGVLARVPLASGLLTGKLDQSSTFAADDHRQFNRNGEEFDKGETFSGVPFAVGLDAVDRLRSLVPGEATMAQWALRWVLMEDSVTCAIPGARTVAQARENAAAADLAPFSVTQMAAVGAVYDERLRGVVHAHW